MEPEKVTPFAELSLTVQSLPITPPLAMTTPDPDEFSTTGRDLGWALRGPARAPEEYPCPLMGTKRGNGAIIPDS